MQLVGKPSSADAMKSGIFFTCFRMDAIFTRTADPRAKVQVFKFLLHGMKQFETYLNGAGRLGFTGFTPKDSQAEAARNTPPFGQENKQIVPSLVLNMSNHVS